MDATDNIFDALDHADDGIRMVSLVFNVTLYSDRSFRYEHESVMRVFEKYFEICPTDKFSYYATTNMRKHRAIGKRTFGTLASWMKPGAPRRADMDLELKDGDVYQDAPKFKFSVAAREEGSVGHEKKNANVISMSFPPDFLGPERAARFVREVCDAFPFQSGIAGYCLECSRYDKHQSEMAAYDLTKRFEAIDICRLPHDSIAVGQDGMKGANWITLLSHDFAKRLGLDGEATELTSRGVRVTESKHGYILTAGEIPILGDTERNEDSTLLAEVFGFIEPLVRISANRSPSFNLLNDYVEKTKNWFTRFSDS